jgi:hypothetical protein
MISILLPRTLQQIKLLVPIKNKDKVKELGCKWDCVDKFWYYTSETHKVPEELKKYKSHQVHIENEMKDHYKSILKSMKWDAKNKVWECNEEDYSHFISVS